MVLAGIIIGIAFWIMTLIQLIRIEIHLGTLVQLRQAEKQQPQTEKG